MRGHIRKRGAGYQIIVDIGRDPITNKRKQKSVGGFKTKKEAEKALAEMINKVEKGEYFEPKKMELNEYLSYWLDTYAKINVAPSTLERYTDFIKTINKYLGNVSLDKLRPMHIQKFYSELIKEGKLSNTTILKIHRLLNMSLKHAVKWEMLLQNPAASVQPPKEDDTQIKVWDSDTANNFLIDIKDNKIFIPVMLALTTGMRLGEITALKWDNINFQEGFLSITQSMRRVNGKYELNVPKTSKSFRNIALSEFSIIELKKHRKKQLEYRLLLGQEYKDQNFVCSHEDGRPFSNTYVYQRFKKLIKKLNYPDIRFHDLRHTHATILLSKGVNPKIVSERLGHSTVSLTLDIYSHVLPNMQKDAIKKLDDLFMKNTV